jgi:low affinity Fe/Cu permease
MSEPHGASGKESFASTFGRVATRIAGWMGSPAAFGFAILCVVVWGATGPRYRYSNTWQLVINTATTIVTFLMVFVIQNTQNRDARAIHLKLDEVIRSIRTAQNEMINIETLSDAELGELSKRYERIRKEWEQRKSERGS